MIVVDVDTKRFIERCRSDDLSRRERGAAEQQIVRQRARFGGQPTLRENARPTTAQFDAVGVVGAERVCVELDRPSAPGGGKGDAFGSVVAAEGSDQQRVEFSNHVTETNAELDG